MESREPSALQATLLARCPRCGRAPLFAGFLAIAPRCSACGLDYSNFDVGDGATVFVILFAGIVVAGGALVVEAKYSPPYWVHAVLWLPLIVILVLGGLRLGKSLLMVLQYKHQAREGRLKE
ncbi:MAG TPA: DUF983 domain-containing protein [Rhizomicrobium sp.]|nr:DUF983 domain-containing protein [Rhizomicrobium sp.]